MCEEETLYKRLGGYDAISSVVEMLLPKLITDPNLGRFWKNRGDDGIAREKQLLINYLCANSGGPVLYIGRDNLTTHRGMGITEQDWTEFIIHLKDTLNHFQVNDVEMNDVLEFIESTKIDIIGDTP